MTLKTAGGGGFHGNVGVCAEVESRCPGGGGCVQVVSGCRWCPAGVWMMDIF